MEINDYIKLNTQLVKLYVNVVISEIITNSTAFN